MQQPLAGVPSRVQAGGVEVQLDSPLHSQAPAAAAAEGAIRHWAQGAEAHGQSGTESARASLARNKQL